MNGFGLVKSWQEHEDRREKKKIRGTGLRKAFRVSRKLLLP